MKALLITILFVLGASEVKAQGTWVVMPPQHGFQTVVQPDNQHRIYAYPQQGTPVPYGYDYGATPMYGYPSQPITDGYATGYAAGQMFRFLLDSGAE